MRRRKMDRLDFHQTPYTGKVAAIYVRVSSNDLKRCSKKDKVRRLRESVQTQEADGIEYATKHNWQFEVFKADCNISGFEDAERADLAKIIRLCKEGRIHSIITRDPYRISRNVSLTSDILYKTLLPCGVNVVCLDMAIDVSTPEGQEAFINYGLKGQAQLQYTSKTSMRNKRKLVEDGGFAGKPPYGWRCASREKNAVEQVPEQIAVVKKVFEAYANGKTIGQIIANLRSEGIIRPIAGNTDWSIGDVGRMMRRCQYIGKVRFKGKEYASPYTPPVIDLVTWERVQDRLRKNETRAQREKGSRWLASGLLKCGLCATRKKAGNHVRFGALHVYGGTPSASGTSQLYYYHCAEQHRYGLERCPGVTISVPIIDSFLRSIVAYWAISGTLHPADAGTIKAEVLGVEKRINTLHNQKQALITRFVSAGGTPEDLAVATTQINRKIDSAGRDLREAQTRLTAVDTSAALAAVDRLSEWDTLDIQTRRSLLRAVLDRIEVYPDRIELFTTMNRQQAAIFPIKKVWRTRTIVTDQFDSAAMSMQIAVDYSTERPEE